MHAYMHVHTRRHVHTQTVPFVGEANVLASLSAKRPNSVSKNTILTAPDAASTR